MTTNDEQAFHTAILETPDDDTPRLVFADWLDERATGDDAARAALIRAQCQLEHLAPRDKHRRTLEKQVKALLRANAGRWLKELRAGNLGDGWAFRRGFIDAVSISPTEFLRNAEFIFRHAPMLRTVQFPHARSEVTALAASPFLARLASVDLTQMCTCGQCPIDVELRDLFRSKHARGLSHLDLSLDRIDAEMVRALIASEPLSRLASLDLSQNPLNTDGVQALTLGKHFTWLNSLNLSSTDLRQAGAEALAAATNFPALTRLNLRDNRLWAGGVRALAASPLFLQLTELDLGGNRIGEGGAAALASAPPSAKLVALNVGRNRLSEKARRALKTRFGKGVKFE